ncbi:M48 family metalloprotease [Halocynthiibacter sp. C4]|uniref:M48 family metalloprotease n=1 Tax=Halocynthiibacter sp. C4 TaxID=2992758 RepID=UPI00237BFDC6|nr:M48 family metalloprotease [Halocynthiibacter sp. C4]MDE0589844.1 M48 family metalloprotease [Halocynthiibacter sp. C4]
MQTRRQSPFRRAILVLCWLLLVPQTLFAQGIIRDPDIEHALGKLAEPVLSAAGLNPGRVKIIMINDSSMNAFVIDRRHIFIHTGMILKMKRAAELQGVIAHEAAHIANGHITRRAVNAGGASSLAKLGLLLGAAAAAASGRGDVGLAVAAGTAGSARRGLLGHTRAEEASADQASFRYMARAGIDPNGIIDVLDIFAGQESLALNRQDAYARSHPLSRDRLRAAKGFAAAYEGKTKPQAEADYWFTRAKIKLEAFVRNPKSVLRKAKNGDTSELAQLRRAIGYHRLAQGDKAAAAINEVVAMRPNDPYYQELRAQILYESRQYSAATNAYAKAVSLAPRNALILAGYGRSLLALDTRESNKKALDVLVKAAGRDANDPRMLRDLAVAYAKNGNNGMASLVTAERYALLGRFDDAALHANRALGQLPGGSAGSRKAQDIVFIAKNAPRKGRKR